MGDSTENKTYDVPKLTDETAVMVQNLLCEWMNRHRVSPVSLSSLELLMVRGAFGDGRVLNIVGALGDSGFKHLKENGLTLSFVSRALVVVKVFFDWDLLKK